MTSHWRIYTPIDDVTTFDAAGDGPIVADAQVIANTRTGATHPVHLRTGELASVEYTRRYAPGSSRRRAPSRGPGDRA